jgi:hypothetical protein
MVKTIFSNETANAAMTEVLNKLTEMYKDTTVEVANTFDQPNMVEISSKTDEGYAIVMAVFNEDEGKIYVGAILDGEEVSTDSIDPKVLNITVDGLVDVMVSVYNGISNNVVAKIREYVKNYNGPMVNYYGLSEFIYMRWDNFTEDEKEYVMDHEFIVKNNTEYYLKKDNIIVKEMLVEENGIVVYVEW